VSLLDAYRRTGADPPFGDPRRAHGVAFEGCYWRLTDATAGRVAIVLCGVCRAPDGVWALVALAGHPHEDVRFGVACALGGREEPAAVAALLRLTADADGDVRDWATFGLGALGGADGPAVREALVRRLGDPHGDTHFEAVVGLAKRRDARVVPRLVELLEGQPDNPHLRVAAHELLGGERDRWSTGELLERLRGASRPAT
jgi:HEAT repeat protein